MIDSASQDYERRFSELPKSEEERMEEIEMREYFEEMREKHEEENCK